MSGPAFVSIWRFVPRAGATATFEEAYASDGRWARLFARARGWVRTELLRDLREGGGYLTLDVWESADAYEDFRREWADEYRATDEACAALTECEEHIGTFVIS